MIDILLLAGVALCAVSVVLAILAVIRTEPPRAAAIALVLGLVLMFGGTALDDRPLGLNTLAQSWSRLTSGESLGTNTVTAPKPEEAAPAAAPEATTEPVPEGQSGQ